MRRRQGIYSAKVKALPKLAKSAARGQGGMATFVVVSVLVVLLTLIALGFARLMSRASENARNQQASVASTYAAESGINDVATYIKNNSTAKSDNCVGTGSLIGSSTSPGPFYNDANLAGDPSRSTQYTCLLLNQTPQDLVYQNLPTNESRVIKMTTSAFAGALDKMMISWQATNSQLTGYPPNSYPLLDGTTWNSTSNNYIPMLRVALYPIPIGGSISAVQQNSRTFFLYPQPPSGTVPTLTYPAITDGSLVPVGCTNNVAAGSFNGTADYTCNVIINSLSASALPDKVDYFYVKVMPIYSHADIKIKTNDMWGQQLEFVHVQAMVDITAKSDGVAKRLQARLDLGSIGPNGTSVPSYNIGPADNDVPDFSVRSANAICKRLLEYNTYYNYVITDPPSLQKVCNQFSTTIYTPPPTLAMSIVGNNGQDNNLRVCATPWNSVEQQVWGCSSANNPDSGQQSVQQGTVYVGQPGSATIYWRSEDAANSCNLSGYGDVNPISSWSTDPSRPANGTIVGSGSKSYSGITNYTNYNMTCTGPGGNTATENVYIWPAPHNTGGTPGNPGDSTSVYITGPKFYQAGSSYTLTWHEANASTCNMSSVGNQPWSFSQSVNPAGESGSKTFYTGWWDNQPKTYTITCYDNIGRSASATWTVGTGGNNTTILPPACTQADWGVNDNGNGTGTLWWNGSCPDVSPSSGYYGFINCSSTGTPFPRCDGFGYGESSSYTVGTGQYCAQFHEGVDPWGFQSTSAYKCYTIYPPLSIVSFKHAAWNAGVQGPCGYKGIPVGAQGKWYCRFSPTTYNPVPCADGVHQWVTCSPYGVSYQVSGGAPPVSCSVTEYYGPLYSGGPSWQSGNEGWGGSSPNGSGPNPWPWTLSCRDGVGHTISRTDYYN